MQKDKAYHEAAIEYNNDLAAHAEELADALEHPEVQRWARAVAKQHRFHAKRHENALEKMLSSESAKAQPSEDETEEKVDVDYRDAVSGEFVSEEYAEAHPDTTVKETNIVDEQKEFAEGQENGEVHDPEPMEIDELDAYADTPAADAEPVEESKPDPEQDADLVDASPGEPEAAGAAEDDAKTEVDEEPGIEVTTVPAEEPEKFDDGCVAEHSPATNANCFFNPDRPSEEG